MRDLKIVKTYKNHTNKHRMEAVRLLSLVKRGFITKQEAIDSYASYLEHEFSRPIMREFNYKQAA